MCLKVQYCVIPQCGLSVTTYIMLPGVLSGKEKKTEKLGFIPKDMNYIFLVSFDFSRKKNCFHLKMYHCNQDKLPVIYPHSVSIGAVSWLGEVQSAAVCHDFTSLK